MIEVLSYENVRQGSRSFRFGRENTISGRNGIGKTTICDALSFVFTGCDSQGKAAPIHLIQEGKDRMSVMVDTGKSIIERSLTMKKSSTIKLTKAGQPAITIVQNELAAMLCSKDCFLAASVAGWFMHQSVETKSKILSEIVPPVDKRQVLEDLIGGPIPSYLESCMTFTKKTDIILQKVAQVRLDVQRKADRLSGEMSQLERVERPSDPLPLPESPAALYERRNAWRSYNDKLIAWNIANTRKSLSSFEFEKYNAEVSLLKEQIAAVHIPEEVPVENVDQAIESLQKEMPKLPPKPSIMGLPSQDVCSACGQAVGLKHRESVMVRNEQLINEWKEHTRVASEKIAEITAQIDKLKKEKGSTFEAYLKSQNARSKAVAQKTALELKLAAMRPPVIPDPGPAPTEPSCEGITEEELQRRIAEYDRVVGYNASLESSRKRFEEAQRLLRTRSQELDEIAHTIGVITHVEQELKRLDEVVFKKNLPHYTLRDGYKLVVGDDDITVEDEESKSYTFMSTGERIRADAYICEKIANSLPRKVKYIFVDNRDLVSGPLSLDIEQSFFTMVSESENLNVEVK